MIPFLDLINLLEALKELREMFYLPDHQVVTKGCKEGSDGRDAQHKV